MFVLTRFHASFFPFCPLCWPPLFSRHLFRPVPPLEKCSVLPEQRAQHRSWEGALSGWTSPQRSGRKFLPEICLKKVQCGIGDLGNKLVGTQNFALVKLLCSKCENSNRSPRSGKCLELVFMHSLPFVPESFKQCQNMKAPPIRGSSYSSSLSSAVSLPWSGKRCPLNLWYKFLEWKSSATLKENPNVWFRVCFGAGFLNHRVQPLGAKT